MSKKDWKLLQEYKKLGTVEELKRVQQCMERTFLCLKCPNVLCPQKQIEFKRTSEFTSTQDELIRDFRTHLQSTELDKIRLQRMSSGQYIGLDQV